MAAPPSDELVRETMREILRRPEFVEASNEPWYVQLIRWIPELGQDLGQWTSEHPVQGWLLISLLLLIVLALLFHIFYVAFGDLLPGRRKAGRGARAAPWQILEGTAASWPAALAKARQSLTAGNLRLAVWISHRVLLGLLDERQSIRFAPGKTNTDYLRECPAAHPWQGTLRGLTDTYERTIYAQQPVAPEQVEGFLAQLESFSAPPAT